MKQGADHAPIPVIHVGMPLDTPNFIYVLPLNARKVSRIMEVHMQAGA
jgi:hypothetical protein